MTHAPRLTRLTNRFATLLCLLSACALVVAQGGAAATQNSAAQNQPPPPPVKLNVIVTDEWGSSAVEALRDEFGITEDGVPQVISLFAKEALPVSYGLVIDNSGSVMPLINYVRKTAGTLILNNKQGDETFVVRFVDSEKVEEIQAFTDDLNMLGGALSSLYIDGGQTAVIDAVYLSAERVAQRRKEDAGRRRALVLISDCDDRASVYKESQLIQLLRREGVQVFVIAFPTELNRGVTHTRNPKEKARKLAEKIAAESGGRAFFPKKVDELIKAADEISRDLRAQYVVGYTPSNANADGKFRKVEITIADAPGRARRKAVTRAGYFAAGGEPKKNKKEN